MSTSTPINVYEWMDRWSALETRLSRLLAQPREQAHFPAATQAIHDELVLELERDADSTLYWLIQCAASTSVGYSSSHALVCASLCHLVAPVVGLSSAQQRSLTLAALTMNVAMTQLQDQLAQQHEPPNADQRRTIDQHAAQGARWLAEWGVLDADWLRTVEDHHREGADLLARTLGAADRYAALMSPRETRSGRCVTDSARGVLVRQGNTGGMDDVGHALLRTLGICPPGTFVRLEDGRVAVVLHRGATPSSPWVAPVLDPNGLPELSPGLVNTDEEGCGVDAALIARTVRVRVNHARMLQLAQQVPTLPI